MDTFRFRATNRNGIEEKGNLLGESEEDIIEQLKKDDLFVIEVRRLSFIESFDINSLLPVPLAEIEEFYRQMAFLLDSGLTLEQSLLSMAKMVKHKKFNEAIVKTAKGLGEGVKFSDGLKQYPRLFPQVAINMIEVAESNGDYGETFENLAEYFARLREIRARLTSALAYPTIILIMAIGVSFFLSTTIIPQIGEYLKEADAELPFLTKAVVSVSEHVVIYIIILLIAITLVVGSLIWIRKYPDKKYYVDKATLKASYLGVVLTEMIQARICDSISTLLKGGISITKAINIVSRLQTNEAIKRALIKAETELSEGKKLSYSLEESGLFTYTFILVTSVGEQSGSMDQSFHLLARQYEKKNEILLKRLVSVITPIMIVILGVIVGTVALALVQGMNALYRAY